MSARLTGERTGKETSLRVVPAAMVSLAGFVLFALDQSLPGYALLAAALAVAAFVDRLLFRDLALIAAGVAIISAVPITTDVSTSHMLVMGSAMIAAVGIPYAVSRFATKEHAVVFPVRTGQKWTRAEKWYLPAVVVIGYALLPVYMIRTGVYTNWPAVHDPEGIARLFVGTNALGIWDELFFICTVLRAAAPTPARLAGQPAAGGPVHVVPVGTGVQVLGARFSSTRSPCCRPASSRVTKSLSYIVSVHLLFDFVLFLVLLHAHNRTLDRHLPVLTAGTRLRGTRSRVLMPGQ